MRIKVVVPELGFGKAANTTHDWLRVNIGLENFVVHSANMRFPQGFAFHFLDLEAANKFLAEFPELALADGRSLNR